jgi:hypothetical protein
MPFHWCNQETEALLILLSTIPFIGLFFKRLHARFHAKWNTICGNKCHEEGCQDTHAAHVKVEEPYNPGNDWDALTLDEAFERFGLRLIDDLMCDTKLLGVDECPFDNEFTWFINGFGGLRAKCRGKTFTIDDELLWYEVQ